MMIVQTTHLYFVISMHLKIVAFNVFYQKNAGVAMARQIGVDNAHGIYSIHIDADDWVESTMLEKTLI